MNYIKNFTELATTPARQDALNILNAGYDAVNTERVLAKKVKMKNETLFIKEESYSLADHKNIYFVGIGKCALEAGRFIEELLGDHLKDGIVIDTSEGTLDRIRTYSGTHPYPSEQNISAAKEITDLLGSASEDDLVIMVISGGGSALLCLPLDENSEHLSEITRSLTKAGADIYELNTVRKHLSAVKGGQLAKMSHPAKVASLLFSDVLGDDVSVIASGPTVKDETTVEEAEKILKKYQLLWEGNDKLGLEETPKEDKWFEKVQNFLIVTNSDAIGAMEEKARELGYETVTGSKTISGKAHLVGKKFAETELAPGQVMISGGETTVNIKGSGKGGRNQETALATLPYLTPQKVFISAASDGIDNTDAAGALSDEKLKKEAEKLHLDPKRFISENDSYHFFQRAGGQIFTGATGSNVSDLYILLNYK
ncbi:MAG: glycerate kinase [Candidatus Paceibacterota bacterium]